MHTYISHKLNLTAQEFEILKRAATQRGNTLSGTARVILREWYDKIEQPRIRRERDAATKERSP